MARTSTEIRKSLQFSSLSSDEMSALKFLEEACGRKQTHILSLALLEFIEKYRLQGKSVDDIKAFLSNYRVIKNTLPVFPSTFPTQTEANGLGTPSLSSNTCEEEESTSEDAAFLEFADSLIDAFSA